MIAFIARRLGVATAAIAFAITGCKDSSGPGDNGPLPPRIRIVNSVYQGAAATATPVNIDYLIDALTAAPGVASLPGNSISAGSDPGGYQATTVGVHSMVARIEGKSSKTDSLYTTATGSPWVPRLYLTANSHYTIVVAGLIPAGATSFNNIVPFFMHVDDPFPPIKVNGAYQARFRVINAAPFAAVSGNGSLINVFITPGTTPPVLTTVTALATASYRQVSAYLNVDPGTYTLTLAIGSATILSQSTVTFKAGEVRTFILQSTGPRSPVSSANQKLTSIVDREY